MPHAAHDDNFFSLHSIRTLRSAFKLQTISESIPKSLAQRRSDPWALSVRGKWARVSEPHSLNFEKEDCGTIKGPPPEYSPTLAYTDFFDQGSTHLDNIFTIYLKVIMIDWNGMYLPDITKPLIKKNQCTKGVWSGACVRTSEPISAMTALIRLDIFFILNLAGICKIPTLPLNLVASIIPARTYYQFQIYPLGRSGTWHKIFSWSVRRDSVVVTLSSSTYSSFAVQGGLRLESTRTVAGLMLF